MLAVKLQRVGKRHQPSYRLVVAEKRSKLGGPPVEDLGAYDPFSKKLNVKTDRLTHWLGVGARPTVTVHNLLVRNDLISGSKRRVRTKKNEESAPEARAGAASRSPAPEAASAMAAENAPESTAAASDAGQ